MSHRMFLKEGRERSVELRHPWIFSGAVAKAPQGAEPGETVEILAADGAPLGSAAYSPASQIVARMWSFGPTPVEVGQDFFRGRIAAAARARGVEPGTLADSKTACRLVNAESDRLPGLVVDHYGPQLVCQLLSAGPERHKDAILAALRELFPGSPVFERSDVKARAKEGLPTRVGPLEGLEPADRVEIEEDGLKFLVDVKRGHKTGFYLDQRQNRARVAKACVGREMLNCFSYTGGFAVHALAAGASKVVNLDASADALAIAASNIQLNGHPDSSFENLEGDAFELLRRFRDSRRSFDVIVLDPPKFAETQGHLQRAARAYKDINLLAFKLLRPGGRLFTFSCSGLVDEALFGKIVAGAAFDSGRDVLVTGTLSQAPDHPWAPGFPEGRYLKGLECFVE